MGCGSSKNVISPAAGSSQAWSTKPAPDRKNGSADSTKGKSGRTNSKIIRVKATGNGVTTLERQGPRSTSKESLTTTGTEVDGPRGVSSATSKASAHTCDSGLEADYYYAKIITEESDPAVQAEILQKQLPNSLDLTVSGTRITTTRKGSGKGGRTNADDIIGELKSQGLLTKPVNGQSGMTFDVMIASEFGTLRKPPARLAKLKTKKSKKKALTREELETKLRAAEERRKRKEAEKVEKLKERQVQGSLDAAEELQKREIVVDAATDTDTALEAKEKKVEKVQPVRLARLSEALEASRNVDDDDDDSAF